jgi:hypothetical protein
MRLARVSLCALAATGLLVLATADASSTASFHLVFDGRHNQQLLHEGSFTTLSSWCPSGSAADVDVDDQTLTSTRRFACIGGDTFTATVGSLRAEHGGSGTWQIVAGTGTLTDLRGKGTFSSTRLDGSPNDPSTITFRSTWDGVAALDINPPVVAITSVSTRRLRRPKNTYVVRVALTIDDATEDPIDYAFEARNPRTPTTPLLTRLGQTTGTVVSRFRAKLPTAPRLLAIRVEATDAVGNRATFSKTIRVH